MLTRYNLVTGTLKSIDRRDVGGRVKDAPMPLPGNTLTESAQALLADPYAVYRVLRAEDPVHWSDAWEAWFLTRYDDVAAALKDPRLRVGRVSDFSRRLPAQSLRDMRPIEQKLGGWLLFLDPPEHDRLRALVSRAFTPQTIKRMEQSVRHRVERLLCDLKGNVDLLTALASPLPVMTVADMLGGDERDHDRFYGWSHDLASFLGDEALTESSVRAAEVAVDGIETYFRAVVERRRATPQDDLVSGLLAVREAGTALSDDQIVSMCTLLFAAGHDTTTNLIGNGLLAVLQHPDARAALIAHPEKIESAVEEILRYDSPSQIVSRYAAENLEIGGRAVQAGQVLNLCVGAANRDEARFPDPDRFDIDRADNRHLSFGRGIHTCLGAFLARQEASIAIAEVLRRWPRALLLEAPQRYPTVGFRRLQSLRVNLDGPSASAGGLRVRLARIDDMSFVRDLAATSVPFGIPPGRDAVGDEVSAHVRSSYADLEQTFNQSPDFVILIAEESGERLGYIMLDFAQVEAATGERQCFIVDLAVRRDAWGRGTTHRLIEKSAQMTRARGLKYLVGHVSANNRRTLDLATGDLDFTVERVQIVKRCD